jgi:hypothetical protein
VTSSSSSFGCLYAALVGLWACSDGVAAVDAVEGRCLVLGTLSHHLLQLLLPDPQACTGSTWLVAFVGAMVTSMLSTCSSVWHSFSVGGCVSVAARTCMCPCDSTHSFCCGLVCWHMYVTAWTAACAQNMCKQSSPVSFCVDFLRCLWGSGVLGVCWSRANECFAGVHCHIY